MTGPSVLEVTLVGQRFTVPSLAPGASATFTWSICRVGTYTAIADQTQVVVESDETNNTATRQNTCTRRWIEAGECPRWRSSSPATT